jgi:hypothetical protein
MYRIKCQFALRLEIRLPATRQSMIFVKSLHHVAIPGAGQMY